MKEGWVTLNGVPTHVVTWGGWIENDFESDSVVLCITGNPGVVDFYKTFLSSLQPHVNAPVWVINFAGCEIPEDVGSLPSLKQNSHLYNLAGQVEHKYSFIRQYVPQDKKLFIIGHSVGGKIIVELLKREDVRSQLAKAYLMFPTLEHISKSFNGKIVMSFLRHFIPVIIFLTFIFSMFPVKLRMFLFWIYFLMTGKWSVDDDCLQGCLKLVQPKPIRSVFFLAMDEMYQIKELDYEVLRDYGHKVNCYYSPTDGWAPLWNYENIKKNCPSVNAILFDKYIHAFVLTTPKEVAFELSREINEERKKN
ncbi:hypothetical protein AAG570_005421 [Ranatra chinensis]|uniref:Lipid droplet-associated hydrolase n=1 Tax=Ranatra chinensis TaxID=642074 RepID=A0ABD0XXE0_9HEMI